MTKEIKCEICGNLYVGFRGLSIHLKCHNIKQKEYYDKYLKKEGEGICENKNCSNSTSFYKISRGYFRFCCSSCSSKSEKTKNKIKETNIKKFGVDCASKNKNVISKMKNTCMKKYGTDNPMKNRIIKEKVKNTNLERYGIGCPLLNTKVKEKSKKTNIGRYGVENPIQNEKIRNKVKQTNLKRYGTENPLQNKEIRNKRKLTCLKLYGTEYATQCEATKEKTKKTNLKRYGCDTLFKNKIICEKIKVANIKKYGTEYILQSDEIREKIKKTNLKRYGYENPSKNKEIREKNRKLNLEKMVSRLLNSDRLRGVISPNFDICTYKGVDNLYSWKCIKCGNVFEDHLSDGRVPRCKVCFPILNSSSNLEKEVYEFIAQYCPDVVSNTRSVLPNNYELDIYISSKNLAIEFDGLFWHSELQGKDKNYHLNKTLQCQEKGIQLIHIFEDEWIFKKEVVKSVIKSKLNLVTNKIPARKCTLKPVDKDMAFNFLDSNHLQGFINGTHLGLYYNNELVSILTYGKPRFNKKYEVEILRFCNKLNTIVVGGLSKLLSKMKSSSIITYIDRRFGSGNSYVNGGFKLIGESPPSYYYFCRHRENRINRLQFQKHKLESKLESFDPNLTEWENMQLNGYDRIWDCGNLIMVKDYE